MSKFVAWQVVSLMKNRKQSQNLLLKVDALSTFRNNFLQPATNISVAWQVDRAKWKKLAQAVCVMMARAKRSYILIIEVLKKIVSHHFIAVLVWNTKWFYTIFKVCKSEVIRTLCDSRHGFFFNPAVKTLPFESAENAWISCRNTMGFSNLWGLYVELLLMASA